MKPCFTLAKSLSILSALCGAAFPQIGPISQGGPRSNFGTVKSQSAYESNYNANETMFLQSSGIDGVAGNGQAGAAWINPAALGQPNEKWANGEAAFHASYISPEFNIQTYLIDEEVTYQHGNTGVSLGSRYFGYGQATVDSVDTNGAFIESDGQLWNLSLGQRLNESGPVMNNIGVSLKYALAPRLYSEDGKSRNGYLMDLGYLGILENGFSVGVSVQNLGWGIHGIKQVTLRQEYTSGVLLIRQFYARDSSFSMTPVTWNAGIGFRRSFTVQNVELLEAKASVAYSMELKQGELREYADYEAGDVELNWLKTFSTEYGLLRDSKSSAYAVKERYGLSLLNHLFMGYGFFTSNSAFYDRQKSFSIELYNLLSYGKKDWTWWEK